ncbi:hypothetical protein [Paenibacillus sp. FSL H7-0331]|uniref:hypothetical protein n=1 Tax=Paenibacillus sp. FSL H7-0331 TaxID=1920421 RepID=UPI00096E2A5D|nr:hypothetical protein [Paenibacillus sp. FSL H7-0331]OMF19840.1 hypothetical protein BK127_02735 [Paenibacillus sp. FSL H7-0331]
MKIQELHEVQLAVFDGYIKDAKQDGYSTHVTLHALNVMRSRYEALVVEQQRLNDVLEQIEHDTEDEVTSDYARHNRTEGYEFSN